MRDKSRRTLCICHNCREVYAEETATAEYKGYCTQRCLRDMAYKHGAKRRASMAEVNSVLRAKGLIGTVYHKPEVY